MLDQKSLDVRLIVFHCQEKGITDLRFIIVFGANVCDLFFIIIFFVIFFKIIFRVK